MLLLPAVNYDPAAFENAGSMCPGRKEALATFNMGPHRCIGANLARLELKVFFEEWLKRISQFWLIRAHPPKFFGGLNLWRCGRCIWCGAESMTRIVYIQHDGREDVVEVPVGYTVMQGAVRKTSPASSPNAAARLLAGRAGCSWRPSG